jgi:hypothetical protein
VLSKAFLWSKEMEWFRHDSNANLDEKLQEVLLDYGLEGYGLYWYCIELIVGKTSADNITFELKHDARVIARNTGSTPQKVEEMMKRFISLGLFENEENKITCMKVAKRLMSSATSNPKMRHMIQDIKTQQDTLIDVKSHDGIMTASDFITAEENRIEEKRLDKKEKHLTKKEISISYFEDFWYKYPKKVGKADALKSWNKVKPDILLVIDALNWQINSRQWRAEDGKYIPNPATYLNQGRWQDEAPAEQAPF